MWNLQNLQPFSSFKNADLRSSEHLVRKLSISENGEQFVFAIRNPETSAVIYILSSFNLSQRSVFDADCLIKEIRPDVVVVQACYSAWTDAPVPTSSFRVIKRCFVDKIGKEKYKNVADNCVLPENFGTSFHEHLIAAKRAAEEVGSSFVVLESTNLKRFSFNNDILSQTVAVEGLRIILSDNGLKPSSRKDNIDFSELSAEEKSHVIFAQALRQQTYKFKTIVAVVDAGCLASIRKYWHTPVPAEVKDLVEQVIANDRAEIISHEANRRSLWEKPILMVGTGATAILRTPSTLTKIIKKAITSTGKFRAVIQSITASAQRIGITAMRTAYLELMKKREVQQQPVGFLPWATMACSGIKCAVGSLPTAPSIATLGRGIQNLREASQVARQTDGPRIQHSIV